MAAVDQYGTQNLLFPFHFQPLDGYDSEADSDSEANSDSEAESDSEANSDSEAESEASILC